MNNETAKILCGLIITISIVCEIFTLIAFSYQRTVRKLANILGIRQSLIVFLYPKYMLVLYGFSHLKWLCYVYLLFANWIVALLILGSSFVASILYNTSDLKNLLEMRKRLKDYYSNLSDEVYETILYEIDSGLVRMDYDVFKMEEYRLVQLYNALKDEVLATLLTTENRLFADTSQAMIHIRLIRKYINETCDEKATDSETRDERTDEDAYWDNLREQLKRNASRPTRI